MPWLRERIDTNKNNRIDISAQCNEINNFILDKKFWEQNLNELWKHLNNLGWNDNLWIKDALGSYFTTPEWRSLNQGIKNKVSNNEPLSKKELSLLYLEMISWCGGAFGQMQMIPGDIKFDSRQSIDKMCNWKLIAYIRSKFQNPLYIWKKPKKIDLPTTTQKKKKVTINPDRMNEAQTIWWSVNLPENIWEIKEEYLDLECKRLIQRAKDNYGNETNKITRDWMSKYGQKTESEKKAYINYNVLLFAFEKYSEAVIREQEKLIIKSWYTNSAEFENQVKLMEEFWNEIKNKYPWIDKILEKIKKFEDEIRQNEKKYFKNEQETKKAEQNFKEFNKYIETKSREYKISEIQDSLNKDPQNWEEAKKYLQNINILLAFQDDISEKNKMYGDNISKYQNYLRWALSIEKKYNIQQYEDILKKYSQDISKWNKKIDFKKYNNYREWLDRKLEAWLKNINKLQWIITNPQHKYFPFEEIRDAEIQKRIKQESIDKIWNKIKELSPVLYYKITAIAGWRNGFIDATVWAIWSLEIMLMSTIINIRYWIDNAWLYFTDTWDKINNLFKIPISSGINAPIYDPQTGKINLNFDNTIYTTQNALSQMLILIYWWWAMGKWITKAFSIWESVAWRAWLFSMSFISQVWWIYQEAITNWLTWWEALWYSMLAASVQSWLELVSPNEVLLWKWSWIAKELIKNACKSWSKESLILLWKTFTKNVWIEIAEENFQESLQLMTWNLINMAANWTLWGELWVDWKRQNFASTAIITTLTTWIATGTSWWLQMRNLSQQSKNEIIRQIKNDNWLYNDVMKIIEKGISWELKIPSVNIQQLQELKNQLNLWPSSETTPIIEEPNADYFNWKSHKFDVTEVQARWNSEMMDNVLKEINEQNKSEKLSELRKTILEQYKQATWEEINLTDEQLLSILDAHEQDWKLWELTLWQLRQKVKVLDETITDPKVRRFLLEAGFCGMRKFLGVETEQDIELEDPLNNQIDIPLGNQIDIPYSDKYSLWDDIIIFEWTPVIAKIMKYTYETREYTIEWIDNNWATHTWLITEDQIDSDENEVRNSIDYDDIYHRWEQVYIEDNWRKIVWTITSCYDSNFLIERTEWGIKRKKICTKSYLNEYNQWDDVTIASPGGNYDNVWVAIPVDVNTSSGGNYDNAEDVMIVNNDNVWVAIPVDVNTSSSRNYDNASEVMLVNNDVAERVVDDVRAVEDVGIGVVNGSRKLDYNEKLWFNNLPKTDKAKSYLDRRFEPQNKIDLWNWNCLYITDKFINSKGRPIILWYAIENGVINLRFFYRSNSEWCWRSCPWKRIDGAYSKWEFIINSSYETTTKVDPRIWETFDNLTEIPYEFGCPIMESGAIWYEILLAEMKTSVMVDKKLFPELENSAVYFYKDRRSSDVIDWYNKMIPNWLDFQNMKLNPRKAYTYQHDYLWSVNVQVCTIKRNWIDLDFHFARAINSPDKIRIENVVYSDAKINSFWVYDKQVNAGPLVAKPIDYDRQVPSDRNGVRYWSSYMDIRDLYQWNPIIQWYKNNIM